jgi:hypothetical protein
MTVDKSSSSYLVTGLTAATRYYFVIRTRTNVHSNNSNTIISDYSGQVSVDTDIPGDTPVIVLDRSKLNVGYVIGSSAPGSQTFTITNIGVGTLNWTAGSDVSWCAVSPTSGTGSGMVSVSVNTAGLSAGTYTGAITVSDPNAGNSPKTVFVVLRVYEAGSTSNPFGEFELPNDGLTVRSSAAVTGWVLDDIGVESVKIYREEKGNFVYIGDAVLVEGARSDVEQLYPDYPMNYKGGWGYMMLTNFLPNEGNGTFKLHAVAADVEGHRVTLGSKTIVCDNANAVKPFGAIDTPDQGGTASGSDSRNQGWVLTPLPNAIPTDGSTINVHIDGVDMGHPTYNVYRSDIAGLFPGYANSSGAHAYLDFDTTAFTNGVHVIYWLVVDDAGNIDGIGSRHFTIQNSQGARRTAHSAWRIAHSAWRRAQSAACLEPVGIIRGYGKDVEPQTVYPDKSGMINIEINQLERLEIQLSDLNSSSFYSGYQLVGDQLRPLPIGSTLDIEKGIFYWQAGPAFIGEYLFVFVVKNPDGEMNRKDIRIKINPTFD